MPRIVNVIRAYNTEYKQACTWCIIMLCGISEAESATPRLRNIGSSLMTQLYYARLRNTMKHGWS